MLLNDGTTLIIGAGAHKPYGFPTSKELKRVLQTMHPDCPRTEDENGKMIKSLRFALNEYPEIASRLRIFLPPEAKAFNLPGCQLASISDDQIEKILLNFIKAFGGSQVPSIDRFLAKCIERKDEHYVMAGKFLIALVINAYERSINISFAKDDWIQFFISNFLANADKINLSSEQFPKIITFNYDILFERSVVSHLIYYHGWSESDAWSFVKALDITHVYGKVEYFDLKSDDSDLSVDDLNRIRRSIKNIKVIGENENSGGDTSEKIQDSIRKSACVYFLGFGFDEQNMEILFGKPSEFNPDNYEYTTRTPSGDVREEIHFLSTNIGLSSYEIQSIKSQYPSLGIDFFEGEQVDVLTLLKEKKPSLSHPRAIHWPRMKTTLHNFSNPSISS